MAKGRGEIQKILKYKNTEILIGGKYLGSPRAEEKGETEQSREFADHWVATKSHSL